jgi:Zn ribbon nucleic-acid-binding protein
MGRKKKFVKIPKRVSVKCPNCETMNGLKVVPGESIQQFECKNCKQITRNPITQCCIICAFTDRKCPVNLKIEAHTKGLEVRE